MEAKKQNEKTKKEIIRSKKVKYLSKSKNIFFVN